MINQEKVNRIMAQIFEKKRIVQSENNKKKGRTFAAYKSSEQEMFYEDELENISTVYKYEIDGKYPFLTRLIHSLGKKFYLTKKKYKNYRAKKAQNTNFFIKLKHKIELFLAQPRLAKRRKPRPRKYLYNDPQGDIRLLLEDPRSKI